MKTIFECLENGGRAWCKDKEQILTGEAIRNKAYERRLVFTKDTTDLSNWRLEPKEELGYVDAKPYVDCGTWWVDCPQYGAIKLSYATDQANFSGYVWEDGEGKEYKDNNCVKWRDKDGCLRHYDYDADCTIERPKAVRFKKCK